MAFTEDESGDPDNKPVEALSVNPNGMVAFVVQRSGFVPEIARNCLEYDSFNIATPLPGGSMTGVSTGATARINMTSVDF